MIAMINHQWISRRIRWLNVHFSTYHNFRNPLPFLYRSRYKYRMCNRETCHRPPSMPIESVTFVIKCSARLETAVFTKKSTSLTVKRFSAMIAERISAHPVTWPFTNVFTLAKRPFAAMYAISIWSAVGSIF